MAHRLIPESVLEVEKNARFCHYKTFLKQYQCPKVQYMSHQIAFPFF